MGRNKKTMTNEQLFAMCEEAQTICDQMNSMSYNKKAERGEMDRQAEKLDLIYRKLDGDVTANRPLSKSGTIRLQ